MKRKVKICTHLILCSGNYDDNVSHCFVFLQVDMNNLKIKIQHENYQIINNQSYNKINSFFKTVLTTLPYLSPGVTWRYGLSIFR